MITEIPEGCKIYEFSDQKLKLIDDFVYLTNRWQTDVDIVGAINWGQSERNKMHHL